MSNNAPPLAPIPGHHLRVTPAFLRSFLDCSCATPPQTVHASTRAAERAALRHYLDHAPNGAGRVRAQQLLEQITPSTTTEGENPA